MVATRRGARASSPEKNTRDEATETPVSTVRNTRRRTVIASTQSQSEQTSDSQQDEAEEQTTTPAEPASTAKRETRASKSRPSVKQPESTHEADVSESESCCSVTSDIPVTSRSRRRATVRGKPTAEDEHEASKAESSSSSLGKTPRRSTRTQKKPVPATTSQEDEHSEAESCSSVASLSTRVTRSRRKPAVALEDAAHSEADSCSSAVSGARVSTVRRSARSRVKVTEPIPIHLDQSESAEASAAVEPRRTRGNRGKAKSAEVDQAYDSDACQSGPSLSPRRTTRSRAADSDSESLSTVHTSLDSPSSTQGRGTPCSSRTGSASSNNAVRVSRSRSVRVRLDMLNVSSLASKSLDNPEKDQTKTENSPCLSVSAAKSDMEDVEEMEEDANDITVIEADQKCSVAEDSNLNLHENEAEIVKPESKQDVSSESKKDVKECQETANKTSSVENVQAMEEESSSLSATPQKSVPGTADDLSKVIEEPEVQQSSDPVKHENLNIHGKSDQGPSEEVVMVETTNQEGPSSCSEASRMRIEKSKPVNKYITLLDSSEDEESDDDVLSVDGGKDKAVDMESEDETCCPDDQPGPSTAPDSVTGNGFFVIDARPGCQPSEKYYIDTTQNDNDDVKDSKAGQDEEDFVDEEGDDDDEEDEDSKVLFTAKKSAGTELSSSIDPGLKLKALGGLYINFDGTKSKSVSDNLKKLKDQKNQDELLKKSVIGADFEKKDTVPPYKESKHAAKLKRREEKARTTGDGWYNMRAPELTEDLKNDLKALKMRSAMDPKRFYKKNDRDGLPKYFQVGTVVDNPIDFYHSRIPKNERKRTIVEELLADAEFRSFNKRKYQAIMSEAAAAAAGKMNKKKHKFHKKK